MGGNRELVPMTDPNGIPNDKTGTLFTAALHIFCAIVGAGVLALPHSVAWLGWVAGPTLISIFFLISLLASRLLADVYCINGVEHARYHHAVGHILGRAGAIGVSVFQLLNIFLICIAYTITGVLSLKTVANFACEEQGIAEADCFNQTWILTLFFGAFEVLLSLVPNLEAAWWISFVGVATSFTYSVIALVLGLIRAGNRGGTVGGIQASNVDKTFGIFNSLGAIAFAYCFSLILLEIQDTLRQPPGSQRIMKRAVDIGVGMSFVFYLTVAVAGYLAFGNDVPGMILTAFPGPRWLIQLANMCIVLHVATAWQIYAQSMFDTLESWGKAARLKMLGKGAASGGAGSKGDLEAPGGQARFAKPSMAGFSLDVSSVEPQAVAPMITATVPASSEFTGSTPAAAASGVPSGAIASHPSGPPGSPTRAVPAVVNTAPHMVPPGADEAHDGPLRHRSPQAASPRSPRVERVSMRLPGDRPVSPFARSSARSHAGSFLDRISRMSQTVGMYHVDTGFTNEAVPLNDEHYLLPAWQRFVIRTAYTAIITILAIVVPFFSSIAGLVGALTFYPLAIFFPVHMYRKVYKPRGAFNLLLWAVDISMLLVCACATVGAVRGIIKSWSSYSIFGD